MNLLQKLNPRGRRASGSKIDHDIERILEEVSRGVLATRFDLVRMNILANRQFIRKGGGDDFFQIREFQVGDAWRAVDARKTMSTGGQKILVREYRPEVQDAWYIVFDGSPTHNFSGLRQSKLDVCARAAATVLMCAKTMDDLVGCIVYSGSEVVFHCRPNYPRIVMDEILRIMLQPPFAPGNPDEGLAKAIDELPNDGPTNLVWITDGLNLQEAGLESLKLLADMQGARKVVVPQDYREQYLPAPSWHSLWIAPRRKVFDLRTHRPYYFKTNRAAREAYTREWQEHNKWLTDVLAARRLDPVFVQTEHQPETAVGNSEEREEALLAQRIKAIQDMIEAFASL